MLKRSTICLAIFSLSGQNVLAQDADFETYMQQQNAEFEDFSEQRLAEFEAFVTRWREAEQAYRQELKQHWEDVELSSQTRYVEYSEDQQQRTIIDYEKNQVIIEISSKATKAKPESNVPADNQSTSDNSDYRTTVAKQLMYLRQTRVADAVERDPVHRQAGVKVSPRRTDTTLLNADEATLGESSLDVSETRGVTTIKLQLPTDLSSRRANEAFPQVKEEAARWDLPPALVLAIMHTESSFNPMARSAIPAFGLMQIVPQSAGRDVTEFLTGRQQLLSPDYLYNPKQNIEAGSVYLHMLYNRYFDGVADEKSRWYLSIAAYNTGIGNVARTLTGSTNLPGARNFANQMSSQALYEHLMNHLPANETRMYLQKVTEREIFYQQQLGLTI